METMCSRAVNKCRNEGIVQKVRGMNSFKGVMVIWQNMRRSSQVSPILPVTERRIAVITVVGNFALISMNEFKCSTFA